MKKIAMLLVLCVAAGLLSAETLDDKVRNMKRLVFNDIGMEFDYTSCQPCANTYYLAKSVYEKNKDNPDKNKAFNAVYNFATLTYSIYIHEIGLAASPNQVDEAYKLFKEAEKIKDDVPELYEHKLILLGEKVLRLSGGTEQPETGFVIDGATLPVLQADHSLARAIRYNAVKILELNHVTEKSPYNAHLMEPLSLAADMCKILNRTEEAAKWERIYDKWSVEEERKWQAEMANERKRRAEEERKAREDATRKIYEMWGIPYPADKNVLYMENFLNK